MVPRDEEFFMKQFDYLNVDILAAAYTIYCETTPSNEKPMSQREFFEKYDDNWHMFSKIMFNN